MNQGYETFCMASPWFYDAMHSDMTAGTSFALTDRDVPEGWSRTEQDDWFVYGSGAKVPAQGWKIHASACLQNAERVLEAVWTYCVPRGISFKFLRSPAALISRVSKYAPRDASGKLVTIYPKDDAACQQILIELGATLDGEPSPYILSDLRWGDGPLYVRYGAFAMRHCLGDDGQLVPAIEDNTGKLVPDPRGPVFTVPPWVQLPDFLAPHLQARNDVKVDELPYTIERVVHFSNGGGIYVGRDTRTGAQVVLKEARPHSGLDALGHDAVQRLEHEYEVMQRLAGIPGVPVAHELFWLGEHRFCAMEFVDGEPLSRAIVHRYPLIDPAADAAEFDSFTTWAMDIYQQVTTTVDLIHERGIVYGDLHLFNIMLREDGRIALLDYEVAASVTEATTPALGNQGFAAPPGTTGLDVDRYALACLQIALFLPLTTLLWLHRPKVRYFAQLIKRHFPVPASYLAESVETICPPAVAPDSRTDVDDPDPELFNPAAKRWPELRDQLARAIIASATPDRDDRLFPGDVEQFAVGGLGLAYGAAGVLYALAATGAERHDTGESWLINKITSGSTTIRPGFFDGLHGVAFALENLGHRNTALDALDMCLRSEWQSLGLDLAGGLSGIGLNFLHFADRTGEPALRLAAHRAGQLVAERLRKEDLEETTGAVSGGENPSAGLVRGSSGPALLLIRLYDDTGDTAFLDRAAIALRQDLNRCVVRPNGAMEVNEGWRTMPYLDVGSVGIGMVIDEYLARREDAQFLEASAQIQRATEGELYILPGLFPGRAGILSYLAGRARARGADPLADAQVDRQLRNLAWHALPYGGGVAFPGTALLRLSMDLATGTAGVLLAAATALHDAPVSLPLLAPTSVPLKTAPLPEPERLTPPTPAPAGSGF